MRRRTKLVARATKEETILFEHNKVYSNASLISYVPPTKVSEDLDILRRRYMTNGRHDIHKSESRKRQILSEHKEYRRSPMPYNAYLATVEFIKKLND